MMAIKRKVKVGQPLVEVLVPRMVKAKAFQAITFFDELQKRQVVILYSLGEDGIVREYNNNKWNPYPITIDQI